MFRYKEKTIGVAKIDWSLIADREDNSNQLNKNLLAFYQGLVELRKNNRAFFTTNLTFLHEDYDAKVLVYQRWFVRLRRENVNSVFFSFQGPTQENVWSLSSTFRVSFSVRFIDLCILRQSFLSIDLFCLAHYRVPNLPANGWWHEWTFNYDVHVDNNEVHMDIAEREAKILVFRGDNWQPPPPPAAEPAADTQTTESNDVTPSSESSAQQSESTPAQ